MRRASSTRCRDGSRPPTRMRPLLGTRMPVSIFTVVDFPAPFGPTYPTSEPASIAKVTSSTARTTRRSRRTRPRFLQTVKVFSTRSSSICAICLPARAPIVTHGEPPDQAGCDRACDCDDRGDELQRGGRAERVRLVEDIEARKVGDEGDRDQEDDEATEPGSEDVHRILGEEVPAVGERVRDLDR